MAHQLLRWFDYEHLTKDRLKDISAGCQQLATSMDDELPDCAEKTAGLRKLLEAKDCFVRAGLELELPQDG